MTNQEQDPKQDEGSPGGGQLADPNREAVGVEPAWAEGSGGSDTSGGSGPPPEAKQDDPQEDPRTRQPTPPGRIQTAETPDLDDMTKDELIDEAGRRGIDVKADWNKADIRKAIDKG